MLIWVLWCVCFGVLLLLSLFDLCLDGLLLVITCFNVFLLLCFWLFKLRFEVCLVFMFACLLIDNCLILHCLVACCLLILFYFLALCFALYAVMSVVGFVCDYLHQDLCVCVNRFVVVVCCLTLFVVLLKLLLI